MNAAGPSLNAAGADAAGPSANAAGADAAGRGVNAAGPSLNAAGADAAGPSANATGPSANATAATAAGTDTARSTSLGAILLAGGRASRMGGTAKPLLEIGGRSLLQRAVDAARDAGAAPITVAAPELEPGLDVEWVREDPPFGGPAAAAVAALRAWAARGHDPEWTLLLACDLPRADAAVARLSGDILLLPSDTDGICLADSSSRPQWLTGAYRTSALARAAAALPDEGRDASIRALLDDLAIAVVAVPDAIVEDIDTWDQLARARAASEEQA